MEEPSADGVVRYEGSLQWAPALFGNHVRELIEEGSADALPAGMRVDV